MADTLIRCPVCPSEELCEHDQEERRSLCSIQGVEPEPMPEVYNASDQQQIKAKDRSLKRRKTEAEEDWRQVVRTPQGRRVIGRIIKRCGLYKPSFQPSYPDPHITAFAEGQRAVALSLVGDLAAVAPQELAIILNEVRTDVD